MFKLQPNFSLNVPVSTAHLYRSYARILGAPAGRTMAPTGIAQQLVPQTTGGSHYCYHPGLPHCTTALAPPPPVRRTMLAVPLAASLSLVGVPLSPQYPNAHSSNPQPPAITTEHVFQPPQPPHRRYPTPTCVSAQHNTTPFYVVGVVAARISLPNVSSSTLPAFSAWPPSVFAILGTLLLLLTLYLPPPQY
ncbi:hypothetical protein BD779DRAFT_1684588 [Infundibulicybe gibba]|nr:hypothetical protein BD779DRAFT_1684588 [Infundibulicybe gibba]